MIEDHSDLKRVVQNLQLESDIYIRQLNFTLAGGSAAGLVALSGFAGARKNAASIIVNFAPSYICFLISLVGCGLAIFLKSKADGALGEHYAASHNRTELNAAIAKIPEVISMPRSLADNANRDRDRLIKQSNDMHKSAELAWKSSRRWKIFYVLCFLFAFISFIFGVGWPLFYVLSGGQIAD